MSTTAAIKPMGGRLHPGQVAYLQEAADMARVNLQRAVDFVVLHEAYRAAGPSPAASLNEPTVLVAVAAWERFIGDLNGIARGRGWQGPARHPGTVAGANLVRPRFEGETAGQDETVPGDAARVLVGMLGTAEPLNSFHVRLIHDWSGATSRFHASLGIGLRDKDYRRPNPDERWDRLTTGEVVYQAIKLRNAIAHSYLPRMGDALSEEAAQRRLKPEQTHWLNEPSQMFWLSDKKDGLSVQAGLARGVLALFMQLIDQCVVALAGTLDEPHDQAALLSYRLPQEWFGPIYPQESRRGLDSDVYLWRGNDLMRLDIEDLWAH
jgi:hypothetical protein